MEVEQIPVRTAIMRIMSDMLDSADDSGIYEMGRFMDRIEQLLCDMMAAPDIMQLSGSEAVYGFLAWLTTSDQFGNSETNPCYGPTQDSAPWAKLAEQFCEANNLTEPRKIGFELLIHPQSPPQPVPVPEPDEVIKEPEVALFGPGGKFIVSGSIDEVVALLVKRLL